MTNQHSSTVKSTIHSGQGNRQPAGDQGAGPEYTYIVLSLAKQCGNTHGGQPPVRNAYLDRDSFLDRYEG